MIISTIVVDDEPLARGGISALVQATPGFQVVAQCADGPAAVDAIHALNPDLVLLDVQMPGYDGIEVVRRVGVERMPFVIFITAFDDFAITAFELHALDYLLKPFTDERFTAALERATESSRVRQQLARAERLSGLLEEMAPPSGTSDEQLARHPERLAIRGIGSTTYVAVSDIDWIEADSYYVRLHAQGKAILHRETVQSLARRLDPRFMRVHRSALVRIDRVAELRRNANGDATLMLRDGSNVPVSKSRVKALEQRLER